MKNIILILLALVTFFACEKEESEIFPTKEAEKGFFVPQGDNDFDDRIVEYKNKYNSYFLYQFDTVDINWGVISYFLYTSDLHGIGYGFEYADKNYINDQLDFIESKFLSHYDEKFLKDNLPIKMLLVGSFKSYFYSNPQSDVYAASGFDHIVINYASEDITNLSADDKNNFKNELNFVFLDRLISEKKIERSVNFMSITNYTNPAINGSNCYEFGLLKAENVNAENDWTDYVRAIISTPYDVLIAEGGILNPSVDIKGLIRKKYDIITSYFIDEYNVNLQKIGNDVEI